MILNFTKMHGIGNDYIYVNCLEHTLDNPSYLAKKLSDRHFGIGSDGLVLIEPSSRADFTMSMYNSDGSQAEMCGNAIRCVASYVYENNLIKKEDKLSLDIETLAGIKKIKLNVENGHVSSIRVDMGEPVLEGLKIPVNIDKPQVVNEPVSIEGINYRITCVSMGNPHAVIYVDQDVKTLDIETVGRKIENFTSLFPRKTNVEFVKVMDRSNLSMRVWERGAGETLACGTGACAVTVASALNGYTDRSNPVTVHLIGGDLSVLWNNTDNHVYMSGTATKVFDGQVEV